MVVALYAVKLALAKKVPLLVFQAGDFLMSFCFVLWFSIKNNQKNLALSTFLQLDQRVPDIGLQTTLNVGAS